MGIFSLPTFNKTLKNGVNKIFEDLKENFRKKTQDILLNDENAFVILSEVKKFMNSINDILPGNIHIGTRTIEFETTKFLSIINEMNEYQSLLSYIENENEKLKLLSTYIYGENSDKIPNEERERLKNSYDFMLEALDLICHKFKN